MGASRGLKRRSTFTAASRNAGSARTITSLDQTVEIHGRHFRRAFSGKFPKTLKNRAGSFHLGNQLGQVVNQLIRTHLCGSCSMRGMIQHNSGRQRAVV